MTHGAELIRQSARHLPTRPGVYRFLDAKGKALYVGKAKSLRTRVASYARHAHGDRITHMVNQVHALETTATHSEAEALLLEANLIKSLKPPFNIILRDDKSFPAILITRETTPRLTKHRGRRKLPGTYFGPFASAGAVNATLATLQRAFLLRTCNDSVFANRSRPCLLHQLKRCSAPCTDIISPENYAELVNDAVRFLHGRSHHVQQELASRMETAAHNQDYESAAIYRDRIRALTHVRADQGINPVSVRNADAFAITANHGRACVYAVFIRNGHHWGGHAFFPQHHAQQLPPTVLDAFLAQFYAHHEPPPLVLTSIAPPSRTLLREALRTRISTPQRGERALLIRHAQENARHALAQKLATSLANTKLLGQLAETFALSHPPSLIEVYDNSHTQNNAPVGAMICADGQGFVKNRYRTFRIRSATKGDDLAMMREVLTRRFARADASPPDLILVDGGRTQYTAAVETLQAQELTVPVIAIAKGPNRNAGEERFFTAPTHTPLPPKEINLPPDTPLLHYMQRLRDEAHRFAIGAHRRQRTVKTHASLLDGVPGVGPARKRALLHHFGSARAVREASPRALQAVPHISRTLAHALYAHFHPS